jgi:hypothetical protein
LAALFSLKGWLFLSAKLLSDLLSKHSLLGMLPLLMLIILLVAAQNGSRCSHWWLCAGVRRASVGKRQFQKTFGQHCIFDTYSITVLIRNMKASLSLALLCVLAAPGASDAFFFKKWLSALSSHKMAKRSNAQPEVKSLTAAKPSSDVIASVPRKLLSSRSEWKRLIDESSTVLQSLPNRDQQQHAKVKS